MKAKFFNTEIEDFETINTNDLENDSGSEWTEEMLKQYIYDVCPAASEIEIN